jgi:CBS domain-containing protein
MRRPPLVLPREVEVRDALRLASESADPEILAHVRPHTWVMASVADLEALAGAGKEHLAIGGVLGIAAPLPIVHPDEPLDSALAIIGDRPLLPVVHRADPSRLVGVLGLEDILRAYRLDPVSTGAPVQE